MTSPGDRAPGHIALHAATGPIGDLAAPATVMSATQRAIHDFAMLSAFRDAGAARAAITQATLFPRSALDGNDAIARRPVRDDST